MVLSQDWFCGQVEKNKAALYRLARSILRNDQDAEDAVAEALCKAYAQLDRLRDPERFLPWLLRIVANESYTLLRQRPPTFPPEDAGALPCPAPSESPGLWPLVQALPQALQAPVVLFYYEGFSVQETAHILHVREGTVKTRLHRGRQLLKNWLEKEEAQ